MKIRKIQKKDLSKIMEISKSIEEFNVSKVADVWTLKQLTNWVKSREDVCLIMEDGKTIVGFALSATHTPTKKVTLENLWVNSKYRGKGLASILVSHLLGELKKKRYLYIMSFTTLRELDLGFLKKNGFVVGKNGLWIDRML